MTRPPEEQIRDSQRIDAFLKDPAIESALSRMERRYYEEFLGAENGEQRAKAQGKALTLKDLERELKSILDAGEMETIRLARRLKDERKDERK